MNKLQHKHDKREVQGDCHMVVDTDKLEQTVCESLNESCSSETQVDHVELHSRILIDPIDFMEGKRDNVFRENERLKLEIDQLKKKKQSIFLSIENLKSSEIPFNTGCPSKEMFD